MDPTPTDTDRMGPPLHGFQGDRGRPPAGPWTPGLSIALSRESGARGGTIARRVGRKLGWQVYDQELLEYLTQQAGAGPGVLEPLSPPAVEWVEARLRQLSDHPSVAGMARTVLALGAQGRVVLIGRGAGHILPRDTTLHVRIVAPLPQRIAYMAQWLRLTEGEAAQRVRVRDARRAEFLAAHFPQQAGDLCQYDLVLNSSFLGEDVCAELIVQAVLAREAQLVPPV
jgi:hypothetical protein